MEYFHQHTSMLMCLHIFGRNNPSFWMNNGIPQQSTHKSDNSLKTEGKEKL